MSPGQKDSGHDLATWPTEMDPDFIPENIANAMEMQ